MNLRKLTALRQVKIETPCPENWDAMDGDEKKRFCAGCGCHVHNIEQLSATEAESLITSGDKVCTRMKVDSQRGILTRDGWVPRLVLAGAVAASMASCATDVTGELATPNPPVESQQLLMGDIAPPTTTTQDDILGTPSFPQPDDKPTMGKIAVPPSPKEKPSGK